jgi:hypothetical protein
MDCPFTSWAHLSAGSDPKNCPGTTGLPHDFSFRMVRAFVGAYRSEAGADIGVREDLFQKFFDGGPEGDAPDISRAQAR